MDFRHEHEFLKHVMKEEAPEEDKCRMCQQRINTGSEFYSCPGCYFLVHKSCAELPSEMKHHPLHPDHPLKLLPQSPYREGESICDACGKSSKEFVFHCSECGFDLDVRCFSLRTVQGFDDDKLTCSRDHQLILCSKGENSSYLRLSCSCCELPLEGSFYVCLECHFLLHPFCAKLPKKIDHPFHPPHGLSLFTQAPYGQFLCIVCKHRRFGFTYRCVECEVNLDVCCTSLLPAAENLQVGMLHPHCLTLCHNENNFPFTCYACQLPFLVDKDPMYACFECPILLHKTCAGLPREILEHPFHPMHPLELIDAPEDRFNYIYECKACRNVIEGSAYSCKMCSVPFHVRCIFPIPPSISFEDVHEHRLSLFEIKVDRFEYKCGVCDMLCVPPYFSCLECRFHLHIGCIPTLPTVVKHKYHLHPLTLTKIEIRDHPHEDDDAEFYCNTCEQRRNLHDPSYYCAECHYVAHVQCVAPEVLNMLEEHGSLGYQHQDLEYRTIPIDDVDKVLNNAEAVESVKLEEENLENQKSSSHIDDTESTFYGMQKTKNVQMKISKTPGLRITQDSILADLEEEIEVSLKEEKELEMKLNMLRIEEEALFSRLRGVRVRLKALKKIRTRKKISGSFSRSLSF